jgi:hypothetical protein
MDREAGAVLRVIVRAKGRAGERFAIVELTDGRLGITQNDRVLQTVRYASSDIESCVQEFVRRTGIGLDDDDADDT